MSIFSALLFIPCNVVSLGGVDQDCGLKVRVALLSTTCLPFPPQTPLSLTICHNLLYSESSKTFQQTLRFSLGFWVRTANPMTSGRTWQ